MKQAVIFAGLALFISGAASAQEDPAAVKARAEAQSAQISVIKSQLDLEGSLKNAFPNNPSALTSGEKSAEAQILKYATYRAAAAQMVENIASKGWVPQSGAKPLVIVGSTPPSFALLSAYRSDVATVGSTLQAAIDSWKIASRIPKSSARAALEEKTFSLGPIAVVGLLANAVSLLSPSSSVSGASLSVENAQVATIVEQALANKGAGEDYTEFELGGGGNKAADALLESLKTLHDTAKNHYQADYLPIAGDKSGNDARDAAIKAAGANLATALAAYDALHAKLLADANGVETAVAIQRLMRLEKTDYATTPLLYILGNESSVSIETKKGPAHWFDTYPFELRAVATLNYVFLSGTDAKPEGQRGIVTCMVRASRFGAIPAVSQKLTNIACGSDITPKPKA